ncbi:hypothetical protein D4R42_00780 [bacterium]|nr:MAG: hypothetical protein D4R42_00780 [bacterium]
MSDVIAALIGAFAVTLLAIYLNHIVLKPVFFIYKSSVEKTYNPKKDSWFYRLTIHNVGLRAATNCIATMSIKAIVRDDVKELKYIVRTNFSGSGQEDVRSLLQPQDFSDIPVDLDDEIIRWAFELEADNQSITLNKNAKAKLNLFCIARYLQDNPPVLLFESSAEPYFRVGLLAHRAYEGEIAITSSNANPRKIKFIVGADDADVNVKIVNVQPETRGRILRQILPGQ